MSGFNMAPAYGRADAGGLLSSQLVIAHAATVQPERARPFYTYVLGLTLIDETPQDLLFDAGGTLLRVMKVGRLAPAPYPVLGWRVTDIGATLRGLVARGVACERMSGVAQDPDGVWATVAGHLVAWFRDPDGNLLSLTQFPPR